MSSLLETLSYTPSVLKFGTSGRRGLVSDMPQLEIYINALAEIEYLKTLSAEKGGIVAGDPFYFASDLRPSSSRLVEAFGGRGEIAQAICRAIADGGMQPVFLGYLPTPALTSYAITRKKGSIMVTGSHIPFDRNGYKCNTSRGELLKEHEQPIAAVVSQVRERLYAEDAAQSIFAANGMFKEGSQALPAFTREAEEEYFSRYTEFFAAQALQGMRLVCYQHSAVGRDMLVELLTRLGAEVIPAGRSELFVPIDTENIDDQLLADLDAMVKEAAAQHGPIDALVSTDGDSDRPLVLAVRTDGSAQFISGDRLGMIVASFLKADAVVVPISCNDGINQGALKNVLEPKTRIGSPFVIAGMDQAIALGKQTVCGWEANGGFLTGTTIQRTHGALAALPTRDAMLPILSSLVAAREARQSLAAVADALPERYGRSALLKNFKREKALQIVAACSPKNAAIVAVDFVGGSILLADRSRQSFAEELATAQELQALQKKLAVFFPAERGFVEIVALDYTDGVRIAFANGDVAHIRPSGNADELRIYAFADQQARAVEIAAFGVQEPEGLLRTLASRI